MGAGDVPGRGGGLPILLLVFVFPHHLFGVQMVLKEVNFSQIITMFLFSNFLVHLSCS